MRATKLWVVVTLLACGVAVAGRAAVAGARSAEALARDTGQAPAGRGRGGAPQAPGSGRGFPAQQRELAPPEVVERGRAIYSVSCSSCHGADLRGGQLGGPNLLRSAVVLGDDLPELLGPIVGGTRAERGMPAISLPTDDVAALAGYLHSVVATSRRQGAPPPGPSVDLDVIVGDAVAGQAFFAARCASCHSASGDLQGLAARVQDPRDLQNLWVAGGSGRGGGDDNARRTVTAVVTESSGQRTEGRLVRYDDFTVTLERPDGTLRTFRREGDQPALEIRDPLEGHRALLPVYTNTNIHDVTAYLATLK